MDNCLSKKYHKINFTFFYGSCLLRAVWPNADKSRKRGVGVNQMVILLKKGGGWVCHMLTIPYMGGMGDQSIADNR